MALSFMVGVQERRLRHTEVYSPKGSSLFAQQAPQPQKLVPASIRHGAILDIALLPEREMVAAARSVVGQARSAGRPGEYVDDMCAVLVHDHRRALMVNVIGAPADQAITLRFEVRDCRRHIGMARKPRLDRVLVRRYHIDQMRGHQRAYVGTHDLVAQWT